MWRRAEVRRSNVCIDIANVRVSVSVRDRVNVSVYANVNVNINVIVSLIFCMNAIVNGIANVQGNDHVKVNVCLKFRVRITGSANICFLFM